MKKTTKKLISIFLSLLMVLSLIPIGSMTSLAATEGDCSFCGHSLDSHKTTSGNGITNDTTKIGTCLQCSGTPECYDFAWVIALEGDNNPLNKPEQHECSNNTLVHYMITALSGNKFRCKQYKFDSTREKWFALVASKLIDTTIFPEGASVGDGKFYTENPDSAGTYIECADDYVDFTTTHYFCGMCQDFYSSSFISNDNSDVAGHIWTEHAGDMSDVLIYTRECGDEEYLCGDPECPNTPTGPDTSSWPTSYVHDDCQHSGVVHFYATGVRYGNNNGDVEGRMFYDSTSYDDMYDGSSMTTLASAFETNGAEIEGWYYWDGGFYPCSAPAGSLCPDFSVYHDNFYGHMYFVDTKDGSALVAYYDPQSDDPTRLLLANAGRTLLVGERNENVNEENTWYHYNEATDKYEKCSAQGEGSHPAFHKNYALNYNGTQWLYGAAVPVYEGDKVYTAITDAGNECYGYNDGKKLEYGVGFTSVIVKIDGDTIYFCSDHTGDYGTLCDNCTLPCGLCTECGHPWSKHDPVGDCCSLCPVGDGCFDEILGEECVLKSGHDGEHDPWLTITNTDDINAILTKVAGEYKDAEYPDYYSIEISGNATDGFSYVYESDGLDYNAVFVKAKQKGNEVFVEFNYDTGKAGFTFVFDSQGKLTNCYQVAYKIGAIGIVSNYYAYPYTHVHTWNNGTCTLDGTTCSHTNMTTSDATCGTCGITNPSYVSPHTHTFDTTKWTSDSTSHWHAATCEHTSEKSDLANHSGGIATCTALAKCSVCQAEYGQLAPHSFNTTASSSLASNATCTAAATYYVKCDNCTAVSNTKTVSVGQPLAHSYGTTASSSVASNATCTEAATYYVKCDNCTSVSTTKTVSVGQPNGHSYGTVASTTKATDATCTEPATYYVKCNNCTAVSNTATVPVGQPNGHSYATTWTSNDNTHWHAATCGHTEQKSGEANHTYGTTGNARYTCTVCEAVSQTKKAEAELADAKSLAKSAISFNTIFDSNEDVEAIANQAYTDIDNATSIDDVNSIKNQAIADINTAKELAAAKASAKEAIDKALGESKNKKAIETANIAKENIDNAKTIEEVNKIKTDAIKAINNILHPYVPEEPTPAPAPAPAPVTEEVYVTKAIVPSKSKIKVTVNKVDGVDGYQIQYGRVKSFKKSKKTITTKKTVKTIKVKKPGKKYYVRVRSFKIVDGKKVYSNWSKIESIKTK